ncbi:hypothetical protein ACISU4_28550, partial [Streptomyces wuyuanensis]|uniref:hypothetical protein n=1 Tax=Streptomyces wuyuanensis TaxID=1196353 RepID=UPI0037F1DD82
MFTRFTELDTLLTGFTRDVRDILGDTFVGAYVQGSFALGAGDVHSDCDFIVATTELPRGEAETQLRRLHDEIPTRPGFWTQHVEGSYADTASLRGVDGLGVPWLFCDHGHRELIWDTHCNSLHTRWILRNHGITLAGPPIADLVDEVPPDALRDAMRADLPEVLSSIRTWASFDLAWTQRYPGHGEGRVQARCPRLGVPEPRTDVASAAHPGDGRPRAGLGPRRPAPAGQPRRDVRLRRVRGVVRRLTSCPVGSGVCPLLPRA